MVTLNAIQIGVIGSACSRTVSANICRLARETGKEIAVHGHILMFGFEGDEESISEIAAHSAIKHGGVTVAFTHSETTNVDVKSIIVRTGMIRGGGREFPFIISCDAIIAIGGGSGTLGEITTAYQHAIPVVALKGSGGWSDKLASTFLDERKRIKILSVKTPKQAVDLIQNIVRNKHTTSAKLMV